METGWSLTLKIWVDRVWQSAGEWLDTPNCDDPKTDHSFIHSLAGVAKRSNEISSWWIPQRSPVSWEMWSLQRVLVLPRGAPSSQLAERETCPKEALQGRSQPGGDHTNVNTFENTVICFVFNDRSHTELPSHVCTRQKSYISIFKVQLEFQTHQLWRVNVVKQSHSGSV